MLNRLSWGQLIVLFIAVFGVTAEIPGIIRGFNSPPSPVVTDTIECHPLNIEPMLEWRPLEQSTWLLSKQPMNTSHIQTLHGADGL